MIFAAALLKFLAFAVKGKRMTLDKEIEGLTCHPLYLMNAWVTEFKNLLAIRADKVIVLLVLVGFLELSLIFTELMTCNQVAGEKQLNGIV